MGEKTPVEERFRYIGFEVFPKEAKPLFESPEEEKKFLEKIRSRTSKFFFLEREHSLIELPTLTAVERVLALFCSLLTVLGFFIFPVGNLYLNGVGNLTVSGLGLLLKMGELSPYLALGGERVVIILALSLIFLISGVVLGGLQLATLLTSWKSNRGRAVSRLNRLGILPVLFWVAALSLALFSIPTPAWDLLGIEELGKSFDAFRLFSIASWGVWAILGGLLINSSIVGD